MIIVTGATGNLGGQITERLLERVPAEQIGVSVRDPGKVRGLEERGVRVRRGDFDDPASLAHAFEGATQVLIVSAGSPGETEVHEQRVRQQRAAIEVAREAGARRILYTSHMGSSPSSFFPPMHIHADTEAILQQSGVPFTSLRNGFYAESAVMLLGGAIETGELVAPEDGPVCWTTHADLAEAAAIALAEDGLDGLTPALTASEAIDMSGIAEIASELTGRRIRRVIVPDEEYLAALVANGIPEASAGMLLSVFAAARRGEFARVDPMLERLIGHPPMSMRDVLKAEIS